MRFFFQNALLTSLCSGVPISHQNETTTGICLLHRHSRPPQNRLVEQKGISKYLSRYSYDPQKPEKTPLCGTGRSHQIKRISFFDTSLPVYLQLSKSHLCVPSKVPQHLQRCVSLLRSISTAKNESQPSCSMSKRPCPPLLPPLSITNSTFTKTYSFSYILSLQPKECPHTHNVYRALSFLNKLSCPSMSRNRRKSAPYVLPLESLHPKPTSQAGMMLCLPSPSWTIIQRS
jgi:hypothetical protein